MRRPDRQGSDEQRDCFVSKRSTHMCQHNGTTTIWNQFNLVDSSCYGVLGLVIKVRMGHDGVEEDILDITKENSAVNIFDSQDRLIPTCRHKSEKLWVRQKKETSPMWESNLPPIFGKECIICSNMHCNKTSRKFIACHVCNGLLHVCVA